MQQCNTCQPTTLLPWRLLWGRWTIGAHLRGSQISHKRHLNGSQFLVELLADPMSGPRTVCQKWFILLEGEKLTLNSRTLSMRTPKIVAPQGVVAGLRCISLAWKAVVPTRTSGADLGFKYDHWQGVWSVCLNLGSESYVENPHPSIRTKLRLFFPSR